MFSNLPPIGHTTTSSVGDGSPVLRITWAARITPELREFLRFFALSLTAQIWVGFNHCEWGKFRRKQTRESCHFMV